MLKTMSAIGLVGLALAGCRDQVTAPDVPHAPEARRTSTGPYTVHGVYLVPSDRPLVREYARQIGDALENLQIWYRNALPGGVTFTLAQPEVQIVRTEHPASYYAGTGATLDFWSRALDDGFTATGGSFGDPDHIWLYYIDADPRCGQATGGVSSVALLPANDLRGLTSQTTIDVCTGAPEADQGRCRWVGGLGHELGHALGLPHPPDCEAGLPGCVANALMWLGYLTYPDAVLTADDQATLAAEPFFTAVRPPARLPSCAAKGRAAESFAGSFGAAPGPGAPACRYDALRELTRAGAFRGTRSP